MLRPIWVVPLLIFLGGCVQRTVTINTEPKGALVYLNDKEVGRSPVTVPFEWYGDFDVTLRKDGYETIKTNRRVPQPWYEYIPIDFFAEILYPGVIHDDHFWDFEMDRAKPVDTAELTDRALEISAEARGGVPTTNPAATQPSKVK